MRAHGVVTVSKSISDSIVSILISFLYVPQLIEKLKIIILFKNGASHPCYCEEVDTTYEAISKGGTSEITDR